MSGVEYELMFELFYTENILKHVIELLLAQNTFGCALIEVSARVAPGSDHIRAAVLLVVAENTVELGHPGREDGLLAEAVDLGQAAHALLDVVLEHVAEVSRRAAACADHLGDSIGLEKDLVVATHGVRERLVGLHAAHLVLQKQVEVVLDGVQLLLGDLELTSHHVRGLLGDERIGYAAAHKHVDLELLFVQLLLFHGFVLGCQGQSVHFVLLLLMLVATSFWLFLKK